ncbi:MAG: MarR family transcriptional regulator [Actinomycetota bacterium]|nr:MarR family transcriptional regulator [Actinomycetota bacterium]
MALPDESLDQVAWLTAAEQQAWRTVHRLRGPLIGALGRQLAKDSGLSMPDYEVLVALSESANGVVHVRDLLRSTDWEASRLSHHLTRMQARRLVGRQSCPQDGRSSEVYITDAGRTAIEQAAPAHVAAVRAQFIDLLTPAQLATLADIGQLVADRLEADQPGSSPTLECALGAL